MLRNGLEPWHLLIVAVMIILLFGAKKLPDTARALGRSMRILKSEAAAMKGDDAGPAATPAEDASADSAPRVVRSAPGDPATARPAAEEPAAR
ncbi:Sec-independent protein translocase subunit TatA [Streptomyces sp. NPDC006012]|uniref:Sec-independent protein translocase subunit TatA n=1 Tax=Streptomyces sp. NPDC006012 TaxID=3364739 RepID=UPI00367E40B2